MNKKVYLFDWGDTIMKDFPDESGPMYTWSKVEIMPNADTMLKELSVKADCYLATNAKLSNKEDIVKALKRVGLDIRFKAIFCYKELGVAKPSAAYFETIVNRLGVEKSDVVMIGDKPESDIKGALLSGIDAVLYDPENRYPGFQGSKISDLMMLLH